MDLVSTDPNRPGFFAFGQLSVGVIAFGQAALGVVAIGQLARGVFCVGQGAVGVVCVGQGALGLWYATGMLGVAGQRGYGIILHLLPRWLQEPQVFLPEARPIEDLRRVGASQGWVDGKLIRDASGAPQVVVSDASLIDVSSIRPVLEAGLQRGCDRVVLEVGVDVLVDPGGYREAETHTDLVGQSAVTYFETPPRRLAYGKPPKGAPGGAASGAAIVLRSALWLILVGVVYVISLGPLAAALFDLDLPFVAF